MHDDRWLDIDGAAAYLHVRPDELRRLVRQGRIPEPSRQLGPRRPRWDRIALDAVMEGKAASAAANSADAAVEAMRARFAKEKPRAHRRHASAGQVDATGMMRKR